MTAVRFEKSCEAESNWVGSSTLTWLRSPSSPLQPKHFTLLKSQLRETSKFNSKAELSGLQTNFSEIQSVKEFFLQKQLVLEVKCFLAPCIPRIYPDFEIFPEIADDVKQKRLNFWNWQKFCQLRRRNVFCNYWCSNRNRFMKFGNYKSENCQT